MFGRKRHASLDDNDGFLNILFLHSGAVGFDGANPNLTNKKNCYNNGQKNSLETIPLDVGTIPLDVGTIPLDVETMPLDVETIPLDVLNNDHYIT